MSVSVRPARLGDARRIAEIHVLAWKIAYRGLMPDAALDRLDVTKREAAWIDRLRGDGSKTLVAIDGSELAGWSVFGPSRDDDAGTAVYELYGLYVDPNLWRRGAGTRLWAQTEMELRGQAAQVVTLWVLEDNVRARYFHEEIGFVLDPGRSKQIEREGTRLRELRYRKALH
jgi:GNAT superfamily N-acetyltransferase